MILLCEETGQLVDLSKVERLCIAQKNDATLIVASYSDSRPAVTLGRYRTKEAALDVLRNIYYQSPDEGLILPKNETNEETLNVSTVGERMRFIRKDRKLSLQKLGNKVGVSASTISQYELGKNEAPLSMLKEIAKALEVSPVFLTFGEETEEANETD